MLRKLILVQIALLAAFVLTGATQAVADDAARAKARSLVAAAIELTDSQQAVKMLWQATDIDPTYNEAYVYLGLYYNSRSDFQHEVEVYKKLVKYRPKEITAYLNIGEAYMSFDPPRFDDALTYYRKAYQLDPHNAFAALRIGEIYAHDGDRDRAVRYLKQAASDPSVGAEATRALKRLAGF